MSAGASQAPRFYVHSREWWGEYLRSRVGARKDAEQPESDRTSRWQVRYLATWAENETPCGPCALARRFGADVPQLPEPCRWVKEHRPLSETPRGIPRGDSPAEISQPTQENNTMKCKSCGTAIRWVRTAKNGKAMPLDERPDPKGTIVLDRFGMAHVVKPDEREGFEGEIYVTHWSTCPKANEHRMAEKPMPPVVGPPTVRSMQRALFDDVPPPSDDDYLEPVA